LGRRLHGASAAAAAPVGDGGLSEEIGQRLLAQFRAAPPPSRRGAAASNGRGDPEYWADHGELTAALMAEIAWQTGADVDLYRRVGRLHDADYLAHPHDAPGPGARHPVPLVLAMDDAGVHPAICLAVLEHAPYAGFEAPSSRLSAALSAAEDLATLAALDPPGKAEEALSPSARALFATIAPARFIRCTRPVRVETDVQHFINRPLTLALAGGSFAFPV
jgi:hypothetical protein